MVPNTSASTRASAKASVPRSAFHALSMATVPGLMSTIRDCLFLVTLSRIDAPWPLFLMMPADRRTLITPLAVSTSRHRSVSSSPRRIPVWVSVHHVTWCGLFDADQRGEFSVLVVWAVDQICREGIEELLKLIRQLRERHVTLVSIQEPWLNGSDATTELLAAVAAWVANQESKRRSERIKLGLAGRRAEGKQLGGRKPGAKDRKPRQRRGAESA
jgi:hypothetical protein